MFDLEVDLLTPIYRLFIAVFDVHRLFNYRSVGLLAKFEESRLKLFIVLKANHKLIVKRQKQLFNN
jgi:hypothetical protein